MKQKIEKVKVEEVKDEAEALIRLNKYKETMKIESASFAMRIRGIAQINDRLKNRR